MRSFFSPETNCLPPLTESAPSAHWLGIIAFGLQHFAELKEKLSTKKEFKLWGSERYFKASELCTTPEDQQQVTNQLLADLRSFFDEYGLLRASVVYEYDQHGMRGGYTEKASEIAHNFTEQLRENGLPTDRAILEEKVAKYIESWMQHPKVSCGERLLSISPRGSIEEQYPGLDDRNYVFVNIYEKTQTGFLLRQYRSYDPNAELQVRLLEIAAATAASIQRITTEKTAHSDHEIISQILHIPPQTVLEIIETALYARKDHWAINIDRDLPQLPESEAKAETERMLAFCLQQFGCIVENDALLEEKIDAFDRLITLVRKTLLKWVENRATNFDADKQTAFEIDIEDIETIWKIQLKERAGEELASEEKKLLTTFVSNVALSPTLPIKSAASWAHCITGTPLSFLAAKGPLASTMGMNLQVTGASLGLLSLEQKIGLQTELARYVRISVAGKVWYVPPDYLTGKGCYYDPIQDCVMGPCGLPLLLDPYALTEATFIQLLENIHTDEQSEFLNSSSSKQQEVLELYVELRLQLFVRSASLEKILLQDILASENEISHELLPLRNHMARALDPQQALFSHLLTLERQNNVTELERLKKLTKKTHLFSNN